MRPIVMRQFWRVVVASTLLISLSACSQSPAPVKPSPGASATANAPVPTAGRAVTKWVYQKGFNPTASSRELRVLAAWIGCANGVAPKDPRPSVTYSPKQVALSIWAIPPAGTSFTCQSNPQIKLTVQLTEPLGSRVVIPGPGRAR